ncbi:MAG: S8 family serine peptidase, partial [Actinomycetota bacterium]
PVADALVVRSPEAPADAVAADAELAWLSEETDPAVADFSDYTDPGVTATGAPELWDEDTAGSGSLVALIDTGVAPVDALAGSVAGEVDFTGEGGGDRFGHGTYMASLIAAQGASAPGVAPEAGVLSLKVADDEGATSLGQVLGALQWLEGPGRSLGIRLAVLALGVDPDSEAGQLLDLAVLRLAATGVLVITGSGNDAGSLSSPATSPGSLAVGALDGGEEDGWVEWRSSGRGADRNGAPQPQVLAAGVDVVGHLAPDSQAEALARPGSSPTAEARLEAGLVRGSGTSAAAALTAGVAALASGVNPSLDGAELADALVDGAGTDAHLDARATVEAASAMTSRRPEIEPEETADAVPGNGAERRNARADQARAAAAPPAVGLATGPARPGGPPPHAAADAGVDATAAPMPTVARWVAADWHGEGWASGDWAVARWVVARWVTAEWSVARWVGADWNAEQWDRDTWDASDWDVARWVADDWKVARWVAHDWDVARWVADGWDVARWVGEDWDVARWVADGWDVARWVGDDWRVARWVGEDWDVARWVGEDWDVARWVGDGWTLAPPS